MANIISILLPTYNYPEGLIRNLESLKPYSDDIEVIVSDDSEGTQLEYICDSMKKYFKNFCYMRGAGGAVRNWNQLLRNSTGKYVWVIHHDESLLEPSELLDIISTINSIKPDLIVLKTILHFKGGNIRQHMPNILVKYWLTTNKKLILRRNYIGPMSSVILKRCRIEEFDENLKYLVDQEWYYRIMMKSETILFLDKIKMLSFQGEHISITDTLRDEIRRLHFKEWTYAMRKHNWSGNLFTHTVIWYLTRIIIRLRIFR